MSLCSTTNETAASFKVSQLLVFIIILCFVRVSYPFCYTLISQQEDASEIRLFFTKNQFFSDCAQPNNRLVQTDKKVSVYLDGHLYDSKDTEKICR